MITRWWCQIFYSKRLNTPSRLAPISTNLMNFFQDNSSLIRPDRVPSPPLSTLQRDALRGWGVGEFGRRWGGMRINGQPLNCQEMEVPTTSQMNHPGPKMRTWAAFGRRLVQVMGVFFNWSLVLQLFFGEGNGTVVKHNNLGSSVYWGGETLVGKNGCHRSFFFWGLTRRPLTQELLTKNSEKL